MVAELIRMKLTSMSRLFASLSCCLLLAVVVSAPLPLAELGQKSASWVPLVGSLATFSGASVQAAELPQLTLNRQDLFFAATSGGAVKTASQDVLVTVVGTGSPAWTAASITPACTFVQITGGSGTGSGQFSVSIQSGSYPTGAMLCQIQVSSPGASNAPVVDLQFTVYGATAGPFGFLETPVDNATGVAGAIPVTGWALDDVEVARVQIWRDTVGGEVSGQPNGKIYIGDADFVEDARPDVEDQFTTSPKGYRAGWGHMVLTNMLPDQGNGTYTLYAYATDLEGKQTLLGSRTITCANASATKPFGTIDTPAQGGTASGGAFVNFGWALTSFQQIVPTDGSTIWVFIDGMPVGHPVYNQYREDIATLFPGYANAGTVGNPAGGGAVGYFSINTTGMTNGLHTIAWSVTDSGDNSEGLGSRYFEVFNAGGSFSHAAPGPLLGQPETALAALAPATRPVAVQTGFDPSAEPETVAAAMPLIEISELGRLALQVGTGAGRLDAYLVTRGRLSRLPSGATLDRESGRFAWQPGPGYLGDYELALVRETAGDRRELTRVTVRVAPHEENGPDAYTRLLHARAARQETAAAQPR